MSQSLSEYAAAVLSYALEFDPDFRRLITPRLQLYSVEL